LELLSLEVAVFRDLENIKKYLSCLFCLHRCDLAALKRVLFQVNFALELN
jgi:hypothetical protein